jgi:hypothetical protein
VRGLFLAGITCMLGVGVIEGLAVDVLGVIGKMRPDGSREIGVCWEWHRPLLGTFSRLSNVSHGLMVPFDSNQSGTLPGALAIKK